MIKKKLKTTMLILATLFIANTFSINAQIDEIDLYCYADIAMDSESGNILYSKNIDKKIYPASTTKILTAILAIENLDLGKKVIASANAVYSTPPNSSLMYVKEGEELSVKELLYGLMLPSGNDAGNVIAEAVSGKISTFVELMNKKVKEIGCNNTNFTNAHGYHDKNHYTTAYDMALIMKYAMQYDVFREVIETKYIELPATNKSEIRKLENTNRMFDKSYPRMYYEYMLGGKTGYTEEARGTFIGYAKKDDKLVIVGAFDGSQNIDNKQQGRFLDSITMFNYVFDNYNKNEIINKDNINFSVKDKVNEKQYTLGMSGSVTTLSKSGDAISKYNLDVDLSKLDENTIVEDIVGKVEITATGSDIKFENNYDVLYLSSAKYIEPIEMWKFIPAIIAAILTLILIFIISSKIHKNKKGKVKLKKFDYKSINNSNSRSGKIDSFRM